MALKDNKLASKKSVKHKSPTWVMKETQDLWQDYLWTLSFPASRHQHISLWLCFRMLVLHALAWEPVTHSWRHPKSTDLYSVYSVGRSSHQSDTATPFSLIKDVNGDSEVWKHVKNGWYWKLDSPVKMKHMKQQKLARWQYSTPVPFSNFQ